MDNDKPLETTATSIPYSNQWMTVREDKTRRKNGEEGIYGYIEVGDSVTVVAVDETGRICIVETYRHQINSWVWELPGGGCDADDIFKAARRELLEETCIEARDFIDLNKTHVYSGLSTEYQHNLLTLNVQVAEFVQTEDETRNRKMITLDELDNMIEKGDFSSNQSMVALYLYKLWLGHRK